MKLGRFFRWFFVVFYLLAGINHFTNASWYWSLIPNYWASYKEVINILAGIAEVVVAILMCFNQTIKLSSYITVAMLIAFIPSHIYFIQKGNLTIAGFTISPTIAWFRLLFVHPLLIYWAIWIGKNKNNI